MINNPYNVGKPIYKKEHLYGRKKIIDKIKNNFTSNVQITLLHVQRRIGKTSLINCLPQFFTKDKDKFKFVTFSFQGYKDASIPQILNYLADEIAYAIVGLPKDVREEANTKYNFFNTFLPIIINEYLSGKKLVILLDEFDVLEEDKEVRYDKGKQLFDDLEKAVKQQEKLFAILVFGRPLKDMKYLENFLQKEGQRPIEVGLLDKESTQELIVEPAKGRLKYEPGAINRIWELSSGYPSLTQLLCSSLFTDYESNNDKINKKVQISDVDSILDTAMIQGAAVLQGFIEPLGENEKLFFCAVAEAQEIGIVSLEEINKKIIKPHTKISISDLRRAGKRLQDLDFLEEKGKGYQIKVELVRLWLLKNYPLLTENNRKRIKNNMTLDEKNIDKSRLFQKRLGIAFGIVALVSVASVIIDSIVIKAGKEKNVETMYNRLDILAAVGQWRKADEQNWQLINQIGDQDGDYSYISVPEAEKFPCPHLQRIDKIWTQKSNGKFGYTAQLQVIDENGDTLEAFRNNIRVWRRFAIAVGWKTGTDKDSDGYLSKNDLRFTIDAPKGHLSTNRENFDLILTRASHCESLSKVK
ncbi:MAG: GUN4 domain-containing protein [Trichodesmium sp. MAG_R03]|nr:GUN4 domain-containing protein [Trichodesmium sp. MAG_R03]